MLNKLLKNDSGNIVLVVGLIGMIAGGILFWNSITEKVDKEIRSLGASQNSVYMRADFQSSIRKSLLGTNQKCLGLATTFENTFKDYQVPDDSADFNIEYTNNPATPIDEIVNNSNIKCFFNPSRYSGLKWESLKISIKRISAPNFMTLSNFVSADIVGAFRVSGKPTIVKYQFKYRIDVLTVNHFGTVFINSQAGKVFEPGSSKVKMHSNVLFDTSDRTQPFAISNLMDLTDASKINYLKETFSTAKSFTSNPELLTFLKSNQIHDVFKGGIEYGSLSNDPNFKAPWQIATGTQWNEVLDFYPVSDDGYPLPETSPKSVIYNEITATAANEYGGVNLDTKEIYTRMNNAGSPKNLIQSCGIAKDLTSGTYPLYVFNNFSKDFTIDFTENIETAFPPIFCGVLAVNNLIIKLNNQDENAAFYKNHIIGKFIVKGKIKVIGEGELHIHDLMEFTETDLDYALPEDTIDTINLRTQYFNQKYYSTQNFFLPFFKPGQNPNPGNLLLDQDRFYVPRGTKAFFNVPCPGSPTPYLCRTPDIASPTKQDLTTRHWKKLMFEVFNVE